MVASLFAQDDNDVYKVKNDEEIISESFISSGNKLVEFRRKYHIGFGITTLGQLLLFKAIQDEDGKNLQEVGGLGILLMLGGNIYSFIAFNQIGEAGEDLILAGKQKQ